MSNARTMGWMAAAIALAVISHLILDMRGSGISRMVRRGTIARSADVANAVSIKRIGEPTVVMSKASGKWRLVSPFRASADSQSVLVLLDALAFAPIVDSMDESDLRKLDRSRKDFGLTAPRVEVETIGPAGSEKVFFGDSTPAGDGIYALVEGESVVFVVATNVFAAVDKPADSFRSRALFGIGEDEVGAFDIKRTNGVFARFVRDGDKWRMSEPKRHDASSSKVRKFVSTMLNAQAEGFVWPVGASNETDVASASLLAGYGLDADNALTLIFKGRDGADRQVAFGKDADEGFAYAVAHNGTAIVKVDASLKDLVASGVDEFVDTRLFPVEESSVSSVVVTDGDMQYIMAKDADGSWRLDAPVSAPADSPAVNALVSRLLALDKADADENGVRVSLASGSEPVKVSREAVFPGNAPEVFRSKIMLDIVPSQVRRIVVSKGSASVAVVYDASRRAWNVESSQSGGVADTENLDAMLSVLNPMRASKVVKLKASATEMAEYGLDDPFCTIAVDRAQEDSVRKNIRIGAEAKGGRYATIGSADAVFVIPDNLVKKFVAPIAR